MAIVTLSRNECSHDLLPKVCVVCGASAPGYLGVSYSWSPRWSHWLGIAVIMQWRMTLRLPLCDPHVRERRRRARRSWYALTGLLALSAGAMTLAAATRGLDVAYVFLGTYLASCCVFVIWAIVAAFVRRREVGPTRITDRSITLQRVHAAFVAAVREQRDRGGDPFADRRFGDLRDDFDEDTVPTAQDRQPRE